MKTKSKKKTKRQLKKEAERSAMIIKRIETQPRSAFKNSCVVTCVDLHISPQQKSEREKIMKAKRSKKTKRSRGKVTARKPARKIAGKSGLPVCATWIKAFQNKAIKTKAACTKKMKAEFPSRKSKVFNFPNVVVARANKGLLDGKAHNFKKYAS